MRFRLFLSFALIILITVTSVVLIVRHNTVDEVRQYMFRGGMMGLNGLVTSLEDCYLEQGSWEPCTPLLEGNGPHSSAMPGGMMEGRMGRNGPGTPGGPRLRLLDDEGTVIGDTRPTLQGQGEPPPTLNGAIPLRVGDQGNQVEGYLLPESQFIFTPQNESVLISRLNKAALTAAAISGLAAILLAAYLGHLILKPIQELTHAAEKIKSGDFSYRVDIKGQGEPATLGQVFNQMAHSIQNATERRKELTADIAHELRTPLSVQQAHLEAMEDGIYDLTTENLQTIREQNQSLIRLVDDLRTLSLADTGELTLERTETDLSQLVKRTLKRFKPRMKEKNIQVSLSLPETSLKMIIDPQRIEQILVNLLSNAVKHSPQAGNVNVMLEKSQDQVILSIHDQGMGIPEDELPHIFERFYKSNKTRNEEDGGTGLGLSISQKLALAHGGSLDARNHPQGGAEFSLILPA